MGKTPRCNECRKKTLIGFDCPCGKYYCITHRHHECSESLKKLETDKEKLKTKLVLESTQDVKLEKI
jgi:hypothetical protein